MTETTDTETLPPLAKSIGGQLKDLVAHGYTHGQHDQQAGHEPGPEMPECLEDHLAGLAAVLFGLTRADEANSTIGMTVEVPLEAADLPEGLIEDLQKAVGEALEKIGKQP